MIPFYPWAKQAIVPTSNEIVTGSCWPIVSVCVCVSCGDSGRLELTKVDRQKPDNSLCHACKLTKIHPHAHVHRNTGGEAAESGASDWSPEEEGEGQ